MNKYHYISYEKESWDSEQLVELIKAEQWVGRDSVIVTMDSNYSSRLSQFVSHKLSHLNGNEFFEKSTLEIPNQGGIFIYNQCILDYQFYDKYLGEWALNNLVKGYRYLFIYAGPTNDKPLCKAQAVIRTTYPDIQVRFCSPYKEKDSFFHLDYCVEDYDGKLLYEWENSDINKTKNYDNR